MAEACGNEVQTYNVTISVTDLLTVPASVVMLAVIVIGVLAVTVPIEVASPELEIVTCVVSLEFQLTMLVMSVPSCAVAVN